MVSILKSDQVLDFFNTWYKGSNKSNTMVCKGLKNLGNTCFLNSVLQAMSSCPGFLEHLKCVSKINKRATFTKELLLCLSELRSSAGSYSVNPRKLFKELVSYNRDFDGNNEQDALEAFESMLSCIKEENTYIIDETRKNNTCETIGLSHSLTPRKLRLNPRSLSTNICSLSNPFEGWMCSHLRCLACSRNEGEVSHRWMPARHQVFTTIPLPIPDRKSNAGLSTSLHSCLEEFFRMEELNGVNCSACSSKSTLQSFQRKHGQQKSSLHKQKSNMESLEQAPTIEQAQKACEDELVVSILASAIEKYSSVIVTGKNDSFVLDADRAFLIITSPLTNSVEFINRSDLEARSKYLSSSTCSNSSAGGSPTCTADIVKLRDGSLSCTSSDSGHPSINVSPSKIEMLFLSLRQQVRSDAVKYTSVSRLPELLCLYLCRRVYDENTGMMRKRSEHIAFPLVLHMDSYCSADGEFRRTPILSPSSILASAAVHSLAERYSLCAVVEHQGNADTGHYVAYCVIPPQSQQDSGKRRWEMFSDDRHVEVTESKVLSAQATMLFYDKIH